MHLNVSSVTFFLLAGLLVTMGCTTAVETPPQIGVVAVSLTVDFPTDAQLDAVDVKVDCAADATVFDVLQRAKQTACWSLSIALSSKTQRPFLSKQSMALAGSKVNFGLTPSMVNWLKKAVERLRLNPIRKFVGCLGNRQRN